MKLLPKSLPSLKPVHLLLAGVILLGLGLRLHKLGTFPTNTETHDEYAWTFLGASLIQNQYPSSWSYFPYPNRTDRTINGHFYPIVTPVMDHPPLFSLFPGLMQTVFGESWDAPVDSSILRLSVLPFYVASLILLYKIGTHISSQKTGLLAALLYATLPTLVFTNKLILAENMLTTLLLLQFYLAIKAKSDRKHYRLLVISSAAAILTKISGVVIPLTTLVTMFLLDDKRWQYVFKGVIAGLIALFLYALAFDIQLFIKIQLLQGKWRFSQAVSVMKGFILNNKIGHVGLFDPVMLISKLSLFHLLFQNIKKKWFYFFSAYTLSQIGFILASVGEYTSGENGSAPGPSLYGWYFYPLLTLSVLAFSLLIEKLIKQQQRFGFATLSLLMVTALIMILDSVTPPLFPTKMWIIVAVLGILVGNLFLGKKTWQKYAWASVGIVILCNIYIAVTTDIHSALIMNQYLGRL